MLTSRRARIATLVATGVLGFGGMAAASPKLGGDDPVLQDSTVESTEDLTVVQEVEPPAVPGPVAPGPVAPGPVDDVASVMPEPVDDAEPAGDADPDIEFDESLCVVPGNHGKTVSAVAHGDIPGPVSDAAQSSCGKNEPKVDGDDSKDEKPEVVGPDSEVEEPEDEEPEVVGPEDDDSDDDSDDSKVKADRPDKSDKGAEKAANGNGNGNRNRDD